MALSIIVYNGFGEDTGKLVYAQVNSGDPESINPKDQKTFPLGLRDTLYTWAEKNNTPVYCSLKYRMQNSDKFALDTDMEKSEKKWKITNPSSGQTNVNVTVGDDDQ
ncbi:MAG: hypothetical protein GTO45_23540 [Candidatus Aminicenantes bacterium]|nr:hypothetical protein [Candidatus Aminicenantes bacterium]NIM81732.1 hypothetical protein [Candidatus Aminicenantes bacterium]NIN21103.1 hypothetical protein [Candidatus Aminicenantes bacterium]NIN44925.1 hypothetical protein [Candidatus Aminicenantes bacterium]NIN87739.1 hypothetical protein [Candidatus Aminicenantes bacterium]